MPLNAGARLGAYEILGTLGAGGMGEVYRAHDSRLDREVAIKVLSAPLAADPSALARFEREALSVAKLSHPNILAIFEFVQDGRTAFVVTELVDGDTLRARIATGPLPQRRAVAYALQIARGIAAAHARGIVHRDLKPENVMITRDDQVKILDFGLAKSIDLVPGEPEVTRGGGLTTNAGTVLGTFGYMAPEQVRGLAVDHRADMFAFGAVLYEMLSGVRAFKGETAADTMTAILTKDPPELDTTAVAISPGLERIVRRCLEKTPELRFQSANDLAFALETLSGLSSMSSTASMVDARRVDPTKRASWVPWAVAAAAVAAAAVSWFSRPTAPAPEQPWSQFTRVSELAGEEKSPTLSPDGSTVAYAIRVNGNWDIHAQRVGGRNATPIASDPGRDEGAPAYSPDGSLFAFHEGDDVGGIFIAGATGESERRVTPFGFDPAWSPDGKEIAFATEEVFDPASRQGQSALYVVAVGGGAPRKVVDGDAVQPSWSPSGKHIVYWCNAGGQRDLCVVAAAGGTPENLTQDPAMDWSPTWAPDGRFIYFSSDRGGAMNVWRIPVEPSTGRAQGPPEPVTAGVQASASGPRFSRDGTRMVFRSRVASVNPVAIPFDPATARAGEPFILDTRNSIRIPSAVSADGKQIAYFSLGERQEDIFISTLGGTMRRVTDDAARDRAPSFTTDGRSLLFYSNRDGAWAGWMIDVDGGNIRQVAKSDTGVIYPMLSPNGKTIVYVANSSQLGLSSIDVGAPSGTAGTRLTGTTSNGRYLSPSSWSPDGARLTGYMMSETGRPSGVGVYDFASQTTTIVSGDETYAVNWLADSRRIVYFTRQGRELILLDTLMKARTVIDVRLPAPAVEDFFAISPDNKTIYYGAARTEADVWIVERK